MPFDGLQHFNGLGHVDKLTLLLDELAITPIDVGFLSQHKADMVRAHPPSVFVRLRPLIGEMILRSCAVLFAVGVCTGPVALASAILASAGVSGAVGCLLWAGGIVGGSSLLLAALMLLSQLRIRGQATWIEAVIDPNDRSIPESIRRLARQLYAEDTSLRFVCGTLMQDLQVLDPYLLVQQGQHRACLGIWDETGVIAVADQRS